MELPHRPFPEEALTACILAACFFAASARLEAGEGSCRSFELLLKRELDPPEEPRRSPELLSLPKNLLEGLDLLDSLPPCGLTTLSPEEADLGVVAPPAEMKP
jgi:hypothetical protein